MRIKFDRSTAIIVVVALLASALIGFAIGKVNSTTTARIKNTSSGPPVLPKLGFYPGYGSVPYLTSLESFLGRSAQYVVQFGDVRDSDAFLSSVWGEVVNAGALETISGRVDLVESVPLGFGNFVDTSTSAGQATARSTLQATVNGSNDSAYTVAANYLKNGGYPDAIIRLGWEFDGGWMPWSSPGNEALWASAFRHVHNLFKSVSPGFKFDWDGDAGYLQTQTAAYPGDAYVDMVGLDVYDKGMGGATAWNSSTKSWSDPAAAWARNLSNLVAQRDFAVAHGKPVSYPEWGLDGVNATATYNVGGDDSTFIQGMYNWMAALPATGPGSLVYQSYFNEDTEDGNHKINQSWFPKASARYVSLFSSSAVASPTTTTQPPVIQPPATTVPGTAAKVPSVTVPTTPPTTVPAGTTIPAQPLAQVLPAGASSANVTTETVWPGAKSSPYVCCWGSQGQYLTFSFAAPGGPTALALRYSAGNGVASRKIEVDGVVAQANETFPATSSWSAWSTVSIDAALSRGAHTVRVWFDQPSGSSNYINLDNLTVTPTLVIPASAAVRNVRTETRWTGATSDPYICCWGSQGQFVTFTFDAVGGATNLTMRYSAANGTASRKLEIDGAVAVANRTFAPTASWNAWSYVSVNASLTKGKHTFTIVYDGTAGSSNYVNLDSLLVRAN